MYRVAREEPFKEEIFSEPEAMAAYKGMTESLLKKAENWGSYAVKLDSDRYNGSFSFGIQKNIRLHMLRLRAESTSGIRNVFTGVIKIGLLTGK